jgi:hypothetical protein
MPLVRIIAIHFLRQDQDKDQEISLPPVRQDIHSNHRHHLRQQEDPLVPVAGFPAVLVWLRKLQDGIESNRNAYSTTMYWLHKVFLVLRGIQDDIVLDCKEVQLDETCFKVRKPDVRKKPNGKEYAGLSRKQICIGIACDGVRMVAFEEGTGKPAKTKTYGLFRRHIPRGTLIVHDMEHARDKLVRELGLTSRTYSSKEMKKLPDDKNPLGMINGRCRFLQLFLSTHSGFIRDDIQDYLNLFVFIMNPPEDKFKKVEILMNRAMHFRERLKFRDGFRK